jgi:biopolymer transport protein ExbB/biopolymer transport protein TolQ
MWQAAEASPSATPGVNHFSPMQMIKSMGAVAIGVVIVLLIMSVYSIAIMVERYLLIPRRKNSRANLRRALRRLLRTIVSKKRSISAISTASRTSLW